MDKETLEDENVQLQRKLNMADALLKDAAVRITMFKQLIAAADGIKWPNPEDEAGVCYHCKGARIHGGRRHEVECEWFVFFSTLLKAEEMMKDAKILA